jgi:hypothetical protein
VSIQIAPIKVRSSKEKEPQDQSTHRGTNFTTSFSY